MPFIEALRQFQFRIGEQKCFLTMKIRQGLNSQDAFFFALLLGSENLCLVHVSLVPVLGVVGEQVHFFASKAACGSLP